MNQNQVDLLISKYQRHLQTGQKNLKNLEISGQVYSPIYQCQRSIISVWRMILKDFTTLSDKKEDEYPKE